MRQCTSAPTWIWFPDMPCMKRVLLGQKGAVPLVSSQERKARFVPQLNRGSNADPTRILCGSNAGFVLPPVYVAFRLVVLLKRRSGQVCSMPVGGYERRLSPGRTDLSASRPARSRRAPPSRHAPPRPDAPVVRMSRFWIRQVLQTTLQIWRLTVG